jgi:hypothetical protein
MEINLLCESVHGLHLNNNLWSLQQQNDGVISEFESQDLRIPLPNFKYQIQGHFQVFRTTTGPAAARHDSIAVLNTSALQAAHSS